MSMEQTQVQVSVDLAGEETDVSATGSPAASADSEAAAAEEMLRLAVGGLGETALRNGWTDEQSLAQFWARRWDLPYLSDHAIEFDADAAAALSLEQARRLGAFVTLLEGKRTVAVAEPSSDRLAEIGSLLGEDVPTAVVTSATLGRLLEQMEAEDMQIETLEPDVTSSEAPADDEAQADMIVAELDAAAAGLVAFRERVEELTRARRAAEEELADCRAELVTLHEQRAADQAALSELEDKLGRERQRLASAREKVAEVLGALDDDGSLGGG
jgi:MshEN domain